MRRPLQTLARFAILKGGARPLREGVGSLASLDIPAVLRGRAYVISKELLDILVCPENHTRLELAADELVAKLNQAIAAGQVKNRGGEAVTEPVDAGLIREDGTLLYAIRDGIPAMLIDEAIPLEGIR
jgi:uncharacterized protein YbaR (Trm112 family)